jgi:hypothetical protein
VDMIIRFALPQTYSYTGCLLPQTCNSNQELRRRLSGELYYPLWRNVTALDLAHRLSAATPALPLVTVPLSRVLAWQRGAPPTLAPEESAGFLPSIIRLTIDLQGLKSVERLSQRPLLRSQERFDDSRFIIEEEAYFGPTIAHFRVSTRHRTPTTAYLANRHEQQNGLSRLKMPMNAGDQAGNAASTWDTPTPPDIHQLESHVMQHRNSAAWTSFRTVDLDQISGITMLFKSPQQSISPHTPTPLIHTHSLSRPCAEFTFGNSPPGSEWIYVPLPRDDTLLACGTVVQPQLLGPLFDPVRSCFLVCSPLSHVEYACTNQDPSSALSSLVKLLLGSTLRMKHSSSGKAPKRHSSIANLRLCSSPRRPPGRDIAAHSQSPSTIRISQS